MLAEVSIRIETPDAAPVNAHVHPHGTEHGHDHRHGDHRHNDAGHHYAPASFMVTCDLAEVVLEIVDTPQGERMRLTIARHAEGLTAMVIIGRPGGPETVFLMPAPDDHHRLQSTEGPSEPHEFTARPVLQAAGRSLDLLFRMTEPEDHSGH